MAREKAITVEADKIRGKRSTLARAHARAGERIAIAAYLGSGDAFDMANAKFSQDYADQNERDYRALKAAVGQGRVVAEPGV